MIESMRAFLSEDSLNIHKEYLKTQKLKYSIQEKSQPEIKGKELFALRRMRIKDREKIISQKCDILCHELYFSSFGDGYQACAAVRREYHTEASFLYELMTSALNEPYGFAVVHSQRGEIAITVGAPDMLLKIGEPLLAIDLCEHAYFTDYGFDKEAYLKNALKYINLGKLDNFFGYKD